MATDSFFDTFMPYCLIQQPDGRWAVVNRRYKPVGLTFAGGAYVKYEDFPCLVHLKGLTAARMKDLAWNGEAVDGRVYLYRDSTKPTRDAESWQAYADRLQLLSRLSIAQA